MDWKETMFFGFTLTAEQEKYVDSIFENRLTIVNAKSGTGKTTLAVAAAKLIGKPLLYTFSPVEERTLGYKKGTIEEKESTYIQPLIDALIQINDLEGLCLTLDSANKKNGKAWVETRSHVFTRGINLSGYTIIIDEAQNWTKSELKKFLTRIHDDCTVVVTGHTGQVDLTPVSKSGFPRVIEHFSEKGYCKTCELTKNFRGQLSQDADEL